jgi:hypothetical protein
VAVYVSHQQAFEQVAVNVRLRNTFNFVRVKRLNFRTVVTHQRLLSPPVEHLQERPQPLQRFPRLAQLKSPPLPDFFVMMDIVLILHSL